MKKIQFILLVALTLGFVTNSFAQPKNYDIKKWFWYLWWYYTI